MSFKKNIYIFKNNITLMVDIWKGEATPNSGRITVSYFLSENNKSIYNKIAVL